MCKIYTRLVDFFIQHLKNLKRFSPNTIQAYETDLKQLEEFMLPDGTKSASLQDLRTWISSLSESGVKNQSINRKISGVKKYYKFLHQNDIIDHNPATVLKSLKTPSRTSSFIKEKEIFELLDEVEYDDDYGGRRDKLLIELLYGTGIRLSELISLKIEDIDLVASRIKVLGKGSKYRVIPLYARLTNLIRVYLEEREGLVCEYKNLFLTDKLKPMYPMFVQRKVKNFIALVSSNEKNSPHVLRHTFATHLLNNGADLNAIKELLGHASLAATQVYTHNSIAQLKKIFDKAHPKA